MRGWGAALLSVFLLAVAAFFFGFQMIAKEPAPRSVAVQALSAPAEKQGGYAVDESNFPDAVFRSWILDPANLGGAGSDGYLTAEAVRRPFEQSLDAEVQALSGKEYFAEDWDRIVNISSSAKESFLAAGKDGADACRSHGRGARAGDRLRMGRGICRAAERGILAACCLRERGKDVCARGRGAAKGRPGKLSGIFLADFGGKPFAGGGRGGAPARAKDGCPPRLSRLREVALPRRARLRACPDGGALRAVFSL